ncbi:pyridoxamine 5'-phosphate oxidase family protein [Rhodoferax saidenbachensis]|uniref:Pyridoxine 5'-phosphate oxidase superfamily flavin-nucleotide-binding protein n=1 Tax=Rhodoferax saidenbachensis TaxID=1484693 RepID=A0ABU1ZKR7_9BURK|nr:pyridoxamine 5'-phosphate oxidase family protein [Rhodoferax saidenbachensis]MDR7306133.1 putative pyridoxine 5'-phosphate oxidase superfamily flavin-nucleotide-binding protein [Rhodoferax saidenbachensis]
MDRPTPTPERAFHAGEQALQARVGVRERMAEVGNIVMRDHMPDQHRSFFAQLPFIVVGSVDADGQPWASVLAAPPGFVASPDDQTLTVQALPLAADPLHANLRPGALIGLLGIEPHTRRRNRMNGVVSELNDQRFAVQVQQSFGNCPKYIQARKPVYLAPDANTPLVVHRTSGLDAAARQMLAQTDTFFIATAYTGTDFEQRGPAHGVDVSHRGGKPGFVRVEGNALTVPDFIGNFFFNTLGNLAVNPRAGLLVVDYATGDLLYLAADAEIIWDGALLDSFVGAQRLLRLEVRSVVRIDAALPLRWGAAQLSPVLEATGSWD